MEGGERGEREEGEREGGGREGREKEKEGRRQGREGEAGERGGGREGRKERESRQQVKYLYNKIPCFPQDVFISALTATLNCAMGSTTVSSRASICLWLLPVFRNTENK